MFDNITLELSLKPFKKTDKEYIRRVCEDIFIQWRPLLKGRKSISLMLWTGDGSEILDYNKDLSARFEWCRFVGTANLLHLKDDEATETSLHYRRQDYMPDAPEMTYGILKDIVDTLKEEGKKAFPESVIRVGETFDIGPEFAISDFKYNRHTEICKGSLLDKHGFVDATATLNADTHSYAAYPQGIPEGTVFGTFLGKQAKEFLTDLGFDYLWLSNGLGFSSNPWDMTGKIFDGENYYPEKLSETKSNVFSFWKLFREACSDIALETRGTNNSVGIDYSTDGVPLYDIYNAGLNITAPPNSPWAALNDNYGLEIMGHMTRICELPGDRFPFRYYIHDPWWINSPWYDRYDGSPCDIYLPMAISRITSDGSVETANSLNILSIDNSYGTMPDECVNESLPHLLKAEKTAADEVSPVVWVYPMREYTTSEDSKLLKEMYVGDIFVCEAINNGLPLCTVTSADSFVNHSASLYKNSIIISPVPECKEVYEKLLDFSGKSVGIIMYGTAEKLAGVPDFDNIIKIDSQKSSDAMLEALGTFGIDIKFDKKNKHQKPPALSIHKFDNAYMFSVYSPDTTTAVSMRLPLGAPILCGCEAEISAGYSTYHFSRGERRECRVFVEQKCGVVSCREAPPVNARYRRCIRIRGLEDATVVLFSEKGCESAVSLSAPDDQFEYDARFKPMYDEKHGNYLRGEHISGEIFFRIGHEGTA